MLFGNPQAKLVCVQGDCDHDLFMLHDKFLFRSGKLLNLMISLQIERKIDKENELLPFERSFWYIFYWKLHKEVCLEQLCFRNNDNTWDPTLKSVIVSSCGILFWLKLPKTHNVYTDTYCIGPYCKSWNCSPFPVFLIRFVCTLYKMYLSDSLFQHA